MLNLNILIDDLHLQPMRFCPGQSHEKLDLEEYAFYRNEPVLKEHTLYILNDDQLGHIQKATETAALLILTTSDFTSDILDTLQTPYVLTDASQYDLLQLGNMLQQLFSKYHKMMMDMQLAVYDDNCLQKLVDIFSPFMKNEIILMNSDFYMLAYTYDTLKLYEISSIEPLDSSHRLPMEVMDYFKNDSIYANVRDLREPFIYEASIFSVDVLCMNVFYQGEFSCRCVVSEIDTCFRPYDKELLRLFTGFVQECYDLKGRFTRQGNEGSFLADTLLSLINGDPVNPADMQLQLLHHGWNDNDQYLCGIIQPGQRDYYNHTLPYYAQTIAKAFPSLIAFEFEDRIICIINLQDFQNKEESFYHEFVYLLRDHFFHAGFSRNFRHLNDLKYYYKQAEIALKEGIKHDSTRWYYKFSTYVFQYMKTMLTSELESRFLCAPELLILEAYDKENDTEYLKTLQTYLSTNMNAVQTANSLFIHRSTMNYRLTRLHELTDIDFKNESQVLYLKLSLALLF